jgi:hypothetical protein
MSGEKREPFVIYSFGDDGAKVVRAGVMRHDGRHDGLRIPMKPAMHSNRKPATCSDPKPAWVPI